MKVKWQDKVTASGISLAGSTGVDQEGLLLGTQIVAGPQGEMGVLFVVRRLHDNAVVIMPSVNCQFVE